MPLKENVKDKADLFWSILSWPLLFYLSPVVFLSMYLFPFLKISHIFGDYIMNLCMPFVYIS